MVKRVKASPFIESLFKELMEALGLKELAVLGRSNVQLWVTVPAQAAIILELIAHTKGKKLQDILREAIEEYIKKWYEESMGDKV